MARRSPKDECTHPSSHTSYAVPQKVERLRRLHLESKKSKLHLDRLRQKLEAASTQVHVNADKTLDDDIRSMAADSTEVVHKTYPEGSFQ